jgi:hypothetical protein
MFVVDLTTELSSWRRCQFRHVSAEHLHPPLVNLSNASSRLLPQSESRSHLIPRLKLISQAAPFVTSRPFFLDKTGNNLASLGL